MDLGGNPECVLAMLSVGCRLNSLVEMSSEQWVCKCLGEGETRVRSKLVSPQLMDGVHGRELAKNS